MKISIEYREKKYTVVFGKLIGIGPTPKEAVNALVDAFRKQVEAFFGIQQ